MRKTAVLLLASVALLVLLTSGAALAKATTYTDTRTVPFPEDFTYYNPCNGEEILVSGDIHIVSHFTIDRNGGFHAHQNFNYADVTGVGVVSGDTYRVIGQTAPHLFVGSLDGQPPVVDQVEQTILFVSQDSSDNFLSHVELHFTVNANGEVTAEVVNVQEKCVG